MDRDLRILTLAVIVSAIALVAMPASADASGEDVTPVDPEPVVTTVTVYGYVMNISNAANIALSGVEVKLIDASHKTLFTTVTDDTGKFEFTFERDEGKYLSFTLQGYTVRTLPEHMELIGSEDCVEFELSDEILDSEGKYALTKSGDDTHMIGMTLTNGLIFGNVFGTNGDDPFSVEGAKVVAISTSGQTYSAWTDSEGYFEIDVLYGSYAVYAQCNGFKTSETVETSTDGNNISFTLVENEFGIGILGGLDAPHAMMVVGLVLIGIVLSFSLLAIHRSKRPESEIVIINDVETLEETEDDKLAHP